MFAWGLRAGGRDGWVCEDVNRDRAYLQLGLIPKFLQCKPTPNYSQRSLRSYHAHSLMKLAAHASGNPELGIPAHLLRTMG